jgi:hypothetical protein
MKTSTKTGWLNSYASGTSSAKPTYKSRLQTFTPEKVDATRVAIQNPIIENDEKVIAAVMNKYGISRDAAISTINLSKQAAIKANTENKIDYNYTDPRSSSYTGNSLIINPNQLKGKGARILEAGNYGPIDIAAGVAATAPLVAPTAAAMNTSLAGVPGLTLNNLMSAGFAGHGLKSVLTGEVAEPWKKASKTGNPWDYAGAASENIMTGLELSPLAGPLLKSTGEAINSTRNWLQEYNEAKVLKQLPGSPNAVSSVDDVGRSIKQSSSKIDQSIIDNKYLPKKGISNSMKREPLYSSSYGSINEVIAKHPSIEMENNFLIKTPIPKEAHEKLKNDAIDIAEHWLYDDPSQITKNTDLSKQIENLIKKKDLISRNTLDLSRKARLDFTNSKLKVIEDHLNGVPIDDPTDPFIIKTLKEYKNNPGIVEKLKQEKIEYLNDLDKYGDQYVYPYKRNDFDNWSLEKQMKFHEGINKKKEALNESINTLNSQRVPVKLNSQFESKIKNLFDEAGKSAPSEIVDPFFEQPIRSRTKIVYPHDDTSLESLHWDDRDYIKNNHKRINGVRTENGTYTLGTEHRYDDIDLEYPMVKEKIPFKFLKPSTWFGKQQLVKGAIPSKIIQNSHFSNAPTDRMFRTIGHESGHDAQRFANWGTLFDKYNADYAYFTTHGNNPLSKEFQEYLVNPTLPGPGGKSTIETWLSGVNELHSDLSAERAKIIKDLNPDLKTAVKMFRENEDLYNETIINKGALDRFFKPGTSNDIKKRLLKKLPVVIPAAVGVGALEQKKKGGIIKDDRGQWAHPGKVTRINSNSITMEQVPYPVLGVGADGEQIMMYPEEQHRFNQGPVTEYPMMQAKNGGWLNEYSRGGVTWLNEYQNGGQAQTIFVSDLNDPRYKDYQDSLSLYNKTLEIENPKYYEKGKKPSWHNWKGDVKSIESFIKKNNIDYPSGKFTGKIQPVKTEYFGEGLVYPIYKKPVQPVKLLTEEVKKQQKLVMAGLLKPTDVDGIWGKDSQKAWDLYQSKANTTPEWKPNANDLRADGTKKGTGFLGVLPRPDGGVSSEISIGVEFDGKETEIPTMVPTLSKEERDYLLTNPTDKKDLFNTPMGKSIMNKAVNHAKLRMSNGLNPFYQQGEKQPTYKLDTPEAWEMSIKEVEKQIGNPNQWTIESYNKLQNKLNEYKKWRETTSKGKAVVDYHNEPNEYVVPMPKHLQSVKPKLTYDRPVYDGRGHLIAVDNVDYTNHTTMGQHGTPPYTRTLVDENGNPKKKNGGWLSAYQKGGIVSAEEEYLNSLASPQVNARQEYLDSFKVAELPANTPNERLVANKNIANQLMNMTARNQKEEIPSIVYINQAPVEVAKETPKELPVEVIDPSDKKGIVYAALNKELSNNPLTKDKTLLLSNLILAQTALETGDWKSPAATVSNNFSGIKYFGHGMPSKITAPGSEENGYRRPYVHYNNPEEWAKDMVQLLTIRYPKALAANTPEEYAKALKESGYYQAPVSQYTKLLKSKFKDKWLDKKEHGGWLNSYQDGGEIDNSVYLEPKYDFNAYTEPSSYTNNEDKVKIKSPEYMESQLSLDPFYRTNNVVKDDKGILKYVNNNNDASKYIKDTNLGEFTENTKDFAAIDAGYRKNNFWAGKNLGLTDRTGTLGTIKSGPELQELYNSNTDKTHNYNKYPSVYFIDPTITESNVVKGDENFWNRYKSLKTNEDSLPYDESQKASSNLENKTGQSFRNENIVGNDLFNNGELYRIFGNKGVKLKGALDIKQEDIDYLEKNNLSEEAGKKYLLNRAGIEGGENSLMHINTHDVNTYNRLNNKRPYLQQPKQYANESQISSLEIIEDGQKKNKTNPEKQKYGGWLKTYQDGGSTDIASEQYENNGWYAQKFNKDPEKRYGHIYDIYSDLRGRGLDEKSAIRYLKDIGGYGIKARDGVGDPEDSVGFDSEEVDLNSEKLHKQYKLATVPFSFHPPMKYKNGGWLNSYK